MNRTSTYKAVMAIVSLTLSLGYFWLLMNVEKLSTAGIAVMILLGLCTLATQYTVWNNPYSSGQARNPIGYVYLLRGPSGNYKIGHARNPADRLRTFNVKLPFEVEYDHLIPCKNRFVAEKLLHKRYTVSRIAGTEWFALTSDQVAEIKAIKNL